MSLELRAKKGNRHILLILILSVCCMVPAANITFASSTGDIREGNKLYKQEKYSEAADRYMQAVKQSPDSDIAHFNLGDALYKKGQYREAIDAFTKALSTENKDLEAKAVYNIANSKYKLGAQVSESDLNSAIGMYREALDYYKRAIEMKQGDKDAKYNHELVEKKLKVLLDRAKNQQQNQDNNKDGDKDYKDKQDPSQSQDKSGQQKDDEKKQTGQKEQDDKGREAGTKEDKGQSAGKDAKDTKPAEPGKDEEGMTPEEARMLLEAYGQEGVIEDMSKRTGQPGEVSKDW